MTLCIRCGEGRLTAAGRVKHSQSSHDEKPSRIEDKKRQDSILSILPRLPCGPCGVRPQPNLQESIPEAAIHIRLAPQCAPLGANAELWRTNKFPILPPE